MIGHGKPVCAPGARCRRWRYCQQCAAIRQAQIANVAEIGAARSARITYAVVKPARPDDLAEARPEFLRAVGQHIDGCVWTVETGQWSVGLHLNLIAGASVAIDAAQVASLYPSRCEVWAAEIPRADVRRVAAYISKRDAMPGKSTYSGHLYGSSGAWKRPLSLLVEGPSPIAAAAALEVGLGRMGVPAPAPPPPSPPPPGAPGQRISPAHAAAIARVLAIARDEMRLNGAVYVPGVGLVTLDDARRMGIDTTRVDLP